MYLTVPVPVKRQPSDFLPNSPSTSAGSTRTQHSTKTSQAIPTEAELMAKRLPIISLFCQAHEGTPADSPYSVRAKQLVSMHTTVIYKVRVEWFFYLSTFIITKISECNVLYKGQGHENHLNLILVHIFFSFLKIWCLPIIDSKITPVFMFIIRGQGYWSWPWYWYLSPIILLSSKILISLLDLVLHKVILHEYVIIKYQGHWSKLTLIRIFRPHYLFIISENSKHFEHVLP
jgi:hypothetical protein